MYKLIDENSPVYLAGGSKIKLEAIQQALPQFIGQVVSALNIHTVKGAQSGISNQPTHVIPWMPFSSPDNTKNEGLKGANYRVEDTINILELGSKPSEGLVIGIENYLEIHRRMFGWVFNIFNNNITRGFYNFAYDSGWIERAYDKAAIVIKDLRTGQRIEYISDESVEFPAKYVRLSRESNWTITAGKFMQEDGIVQNDADPHIDLTKKYMNEPRSRVMILKDDVLKALNLMGKTSLQTPRTIL